MDKVILCKYSKIAGTGVVINKLQLKLKCEVLEIRNPFFIFDKTKHYIVIQPTAVLASVFNLLIGRRNFTIILDTHPLSLNGMHKTIAYCLSILLLKSVINKNKLIIPNGPIAELFKFMNLTVCNWDLFVEQKFVFTQKEIAKALLYYGTYSVKKSSENFNLFNLNGYKKLLCGIVVDVEPCDNIVQVEFDEISKILPILVWTSKLESFGLVFREYVASGGPVIFLRRPFESDRIFNGVYIDGKCEFPDLIEIIIDKFPQFSIEDSNNTLNIYDAI
jgi:hypothetical protein